MKLSELNFSEVEEAEIVARQFADAHDYFSVHAFAEGEPVMCQLHKVFGTIETDHHNCLGCNFAESIELIDDFLGSHAVQKSVRCSYTTYIMLCYLLVERIDTLFNLIELNKHYRESHFGVLLGVRRWANFIKHPKAFLLTHHAEYSFVNSPKVATLKQSATIVIDRTFVDTYYSNDEKNKALYQQLENKENVLVIFPDVTYLTTELSTALQKIVELIRDNSVYREVLSKRVTFLDYWFDQTEKGID